MRSSVFKALVAMLAGVLLVPLAGAGAPAYAAAGTPTLTTPADGSDVPANPMLGWNRVSGAIRYEVQVSSSADFAAPSIKFSQSTINTRATPPTDLAIGSWWWRVRAVDAANVAGAYADAGFTKTAGDAPEVLTPSNNPASLEYPAALVFSWLPVAGAKTYEVQMDDDEAFVGAPAAASTTNTRYTPTTPPPLNTTRYWHVRAVSAQGVPTQWSEPRSYQMTWAGPAPVLTAPPDTSVDTIEEVVLDWEPVAGASAYELQISPDSEFNAPLGGTRIVRASRLAPNPTLPSGSYFWRVRALSTSAVPEPGAWSETRTFTRAWPAAGDRPRGTEGAPGSPGMLPQVELISPGNDEPGLAEPSFRWSAQRGASEYRIEVGTDRNFSPLTFDYCMTDHTTFTAFSKPPAAPNSLWCVPDTLAPGQQLYWRVKALDGTVNGAWSEVRRFTYDHAHASVPQTAPVAGSTVSGSPVLRWKAVDDSSRYKVTIDPIDPGCPTITAFTYNVGYVPEALPATCSGAIAWTVQAERTGVLSSLADPAGWPTFTLGSAPAGGTSVDPVVTSDLDGSALPLAVSRFTPPLMRWTPVTGATHYTVFASVHGASAYARMNDSTTSAAFVYTGESSTLGILAGDYDFYVEAYAADDSTLSTSSVSQFHVESDVGPTLLEPAECLPGSCSAVLSDTPTLDWAPVRGATSYLVYLATDPLFTNSTRIWSTTVSELTPLESLPDSQAGQATYWFVRACTTGTSCSAFDASVFPRARAFRKTSAAVETLSPVAGTGVADEVTFTWKDYLATNSELSTPSAQEADNYKVEVSTTEGFTTIIDTSPFVDATTYTAQMTTYPDGPLYWRVRAYDSTRNPLTLSSASLFTKTSALPRRPVADPDLPQSGAPVLTWDPMAFTNTYNVEIYKSPGSPLASPNKVVSITTRTAAAVPTVTLPKGDYGWRVQRIDVNGKAGPWTALDNSGLWRFTVQGPVAGSLTSGDGNNVRSTFENGTLVLKWGAVPGASRYLVEASTSSSFTTKIESLTTDMTSWAPGQVSPAWPNATIYWRVTTLDAAGHQLAQSALPPARFVRDTSTRGEFTSTAPYRLLDTRATRQPIRANSTRIVDLTGGRYSGVPASGVSAVVMNVTVTAPTSAGYLTVHPYNVARPGSPNLNFVARQTVPNLITVGVDTSGRVSLYNSAGSTHVILDVVGYYSSGSLPRATRFVAASPTRILDTRGGSGQVSRPMRAAEVRTIQVSGRGGVPAGATSVVMNVTALRPTKVGSLTVFRYGTSTPAASNLILGPVVTMSNLVSVRLGSGGRVSLRNSAGLTHVLFDVVGWYVAGNPAALNNWADGARFTPVASGQVLNTRRSGSGGKLAAGSPRAVQIRGVAGVPNLTSVTAAMLNVSVTQPAGSGYAKVYPSGTTAPAAANFSYPTGRSVSNLAAVKVGTTDGKVKVVSQASAHMIVTVAGWFSK